jgi:hypothetical protein
MVVASSSGSVRAGRGGSQIVPRLSTARGRCGRGRPRRPIRKRNDPLPKGREGVVQNAPPSRTPRRGRRTGRGGAIARVRGTHPWSSEGRRRSARAAPGGKPSDGSRYARPRPLGRLGSGRLPAFHPPPINPVVYRGPYLLNSGEALLGEGFPLRCFQRFARPNVATQRCRLPDNWSTSGSSSPVLSY